MTSPACGSEETHQTQDARLVVDAIPTLAWSARSDGSVDFFNQRWLDYTALSAAQATDPALILETLEEAGWVVGGPRGAAAKLGLKRTTLLAKMKRLGISRPISQEGPRWSTWRGKAYARKMPRFARVPQRSCSGDQNEKMTR